MGLSMKHCARTPEWRDFHIIIILNENRNWRTERFVSPVKKIRVHTKGIWIVNSLVHLKTLMRWKFWNYSIYPFRACAMLVVYVWHQSIRKPSFVHSRWTRGAGVSGNLHYGNRFRKPAFLVPKKRRLHVDGRLTRRKKSPISKISEYVWTGPIVSKTKIIVLPFSCFFTNQSKINVTSKQNLSKNKRTQSIQIFG